MRISSADITFSFSTIHTLMRQVEHFTILTYSASIQLNPTDEIGEQQPEIPSVATAIARKTLLMVIFFV
jgi:hypothetical protein